MRAKSHAAIGIACAALAVATGIIPLDYGTFGGALFGSLAPDLDHPKSAIGRFLPIISVPLYASVGHRTATHSGLGVLAVATLAAWIYSTHPAATPAALAFLIGYAAHVVADLICDTGIEAGWPFTPRRLGLWPHLRTNSFSELVTAFSVAVVIATSAYRLAPDKFDPMSYLAGRTPPTLAAVMKLPSLENQ